MREGARDGLLTVEWLDCCDRRWCETRCRDWQGWDPSSAGRCRDPTSCVEAPTELLLPSLKMPTEEEEEEGEVLLHLRPDCKCPPCLPFLSSLSSASRVRARGFRERSLLCYDGERERERENRLWEWQGKEKTKDRFLYCLQLLLSGPGCGPAALTEYMGVLFWL